MFLRSVANPRDLTPPSSGRAKRIRPASLGYQGGTVVVGIAFAVVAASYFWSQVSHVALFRAAFVIGRIGVLPQRAERLRTAS